MSFRADRMNTIQPSPTLAVAARARELRAAGREVIDFGVGEPDFDTPDHIKRAAIRALEAGQTKYTAVGGTPELKNAVIAKFRDDPNCHVILMSYGAGSVGLNLQFASYVFLCAAVWTVRVSGAWSVSSSRRAPPTCSAA